MRRALTPLLALSLALGLALWQTWPLALHPDTLLVGTWEHPDCLGNHWLLAWVADQLRAGHSVLHNSAYYWPVGDAPVLAGNGNDGVLYLPFHLWRGWPGGVAPYVITMLTLNGLGGWVLARSAGARPLPALAALGTTGISPYIVQELSSGRFTQADAGWLLLFLAAWLAMLRRPNIPRALLAAALLATTSFFYWYYGFFGVIAGALLLLPHARRLPWRPLLAFATAYLVLIGPWLWVFASAWGAIPGTAETTVFPHPQALNEATAPVLPFMVGAGRHAGQAMPVLVWLTGLVGALLLARRALHRDPLAIGLLLTWLAFWLLALGPLFPGAPYTALYGLAEPLRRFWWPFRHIVVANALWGALAALALSAWRRRKLAAVLALLLPLSAHPLLAAQGAPTHVKTTPLRLPPPLYPRLANAGGTVLIEPPIWPGAAGTEQQLIYQRWHHKTLLTGHALWVDRVRPAAWDRFVRDNSFLSALQRLEQGRAGGVVTFDPSDLQTLRDQGVRWFTVNREYFPLRLRQLRQAYRVLFTTLFGDPPMVDAGIHAWDADRWDGHTSTVDVPDFTWPANLHPSGPEMPMATRRPASQVFDRPPTQESN